MAKIAVSRYPLDKKIPAGDAIWPRFNASFENRDLEAEHILQAVYDGYSITTQHKNKWRASENYTCGQHLGLDFDNGDETSSIAYLLKDKFVSKYAAFLYTTMSHTPEAPRARVIFLLDQPIMQAKNYTLAASALLWLFGTADRQCKDAVRFFYGAKHCEYEYLDNVLPLEVVKQTIANYQETGRQERHKTQAPGYAQTPPDQEEVAAALKHIPPWGIDYGDWVRVLMGIHAAFGDGGLSLAERWADGQGDEVKRKFHSFKTSGNTAGAVTIATVFDIAIRNGWQKGAAI